ncbi:hypothetical protein GJ689_23985 [Rhodoplanes serenus]|uniref:Uncharacterized protein n=1 Tax=Rhodoplanes serenus TaxID=200615 RepID=A0A9X5AUA7_9BRAD|nr:hypothetical protein [Rhodoplanes serenus]MTW19261.1 hypothetical protein [Rhodoplanes serenus]
MTTDPESVDGSRGGLLKMSLSLKKAFPSRLKSGRSRGKKRRYFGDGLDHLANNGALVARLIVHDDGVAGSERRHEQALDMGRERLAFYRPFTTKGAMMPQQLSPATKVMVFQCSCGMPTAGARPAVTAVGAEPC